MAYAFSRARWIAFSGETAGFTRRPLARPISSIARKLSGSAMATTRLLPSSRTGTARYFLASSSLTMTATPGSIWISGLGMNGYPNCSARVLHMSYSVTKPRLINTSPSRPPVFFWVSNAASSWRCVISLAAMRMSPRRMEPRVVL